MGPHPPCSHCAPLSIQPPDFSPILTDNHVALRVCSEVGLMRSPLCWAPRRDSHSAFRRRTPTPPLLVSPCPSHPWVHHSSYQWVLHMNTRVPPFFPLFFKLKFRLVCNYTMKKACMQPNNRTTANNHKQYQYSAFSPSKKQRRIPTFGCNFSLSHPFKTIPCAKQQHCVNAPLPSSPDSHLCLTAAVIQLQLFVQEKTSNCKKKKPATCLELNFPTPSSEEKENPKNKNGDHASLYCPIVSLGQCAT